MTLSRYFNPGVHILIWLALLAVPAIVFQDVKFETGLPDNFFLVTNLYHIALFYFNAYWLYPRFLTRKRWWLYIIFVAIIIVSSYHAKLFFLRLADPSFEVNDINGRIIFFPAIPFW